jgi:carboxymethylenebutenolidase
MKKIIIVALLLASVMPLIAQDDITICHTSATDKFAMFASNESFNAEHPNPLPYIHISAAGKMIKYQTPDGQEANAFLIPAKSKTSNWLFVFQEWWGLNDHIKREAEKFYNDLGNVNVLALDMFDGKIATDRETAAQYMQAFKQERGNAIVKGALTYAGNDAKIGTVGWCFGGGQSMQAALAAGSQAVACVIYYGMPEEDVSRLKNLNCDVLGIFATKEQWISPEVVKKFEANMKTAGKNLTVKNYDGDHGFANPSNAIYNKEFTEDAYKNALAFLKARLK